MIDDLKGDESWRMFRIISEFIEGFDKLLTLDSRYQFLVQREPSLIIVTCELKRTEEFLFNHFVKLVIICLHGRR